ncbi:MAG: caspase family protein [Abitibacteriaceae bacterium]|nr:caspase family protein [Abditibacteriaceae bacterium]
MHIRSLFLISVSTLLILHLQFNVWGFQALDGVTQVSSPHQVALLRPELDLEIGHSGAIQGLAFAPDGKTLASGSLDGTVKLWDVATGQLKHTIEEDRIAITGKAHYLNSVVALAYSPDGKLLVWGRMDGTVEVWNTDASHIQKNFKSDQKNLRALAIAPDGITLALSGDLDVLLYNIQTGVLTQPLKGLKEPVFTIAFAPDGQTLAGGGGTLMQSGFIALWNIKTGNLRVLPIPGEMIMVVTFSQNSQSLASGSFNGTIRLWNTQTGDLQRTFTGHKAGVTSLVFLHPKLSTIESSARNLTSNLPAGSNSVATLNEMIVSGSFDKTIRIWNIQTGNLERTLPNYKDSVTALALTPDGQTLASGSGLLKGIVRLWNIPTGQLINVPLETPMRTTSLAYSPDGQSIACGSIDHKIRLWNTKTGKIQRVLTGLPEVVGSLAFSHDSKTLASEIDNKGLKLWNASTGQLQRTLKGKTTWLPLKAISFSQDNKMVVGCGGDGIIRAWNLKTGTLEHLFHSIDHSTALAFSDDSKALAISKGSKIIVWDVLTGKQQHILQGHTNNITAVAFAHDNKTLASVSWDATIRLWNTRTGALQHIITGQTSRAMSVNFSPDSRNVATGDFQGLKLWNVQTGKLIWTTPETVGLTTAIAFAPDGITVTTSGADNTIRIWRASSGRLLVTLYALQSATTQNKANSTSGVNSSIPFIISPNALEYLTVTPEGYYAGSAQADRFVKFRLGDATFPAESFQARYYRPDLIRKALSGETMPLPAMFKGPFPPLASYTSPHNNQEVAGDNIQIGVEATDDSQINSIAFFVNGTRVRPKPITAESRPLTADSRSLLENNMRIPKAHQKFWRFITSVPCPTGTTTIKLQMIAFDDDGLQSPREELLLHRAPTAFIKGHLLGLCVGVSHYQDNGLDLEYADQDAMRLAAALNQQQSLYTKPHIETLINEQATCANIKVNLDRCIQQVTRADTIIIFLSGHGWSNDEQNFYFATHEVDRKNIEGTALPWREVTARLDQLSEKSKLLIILLDACHSGTAKITRTPNRASNEGLMRATNAHSGVLVLTSCASSEVSVELPDQKHGAFTKAILDVLGGRGKSKKSNAHPIQHNLSLWKFIDYVKDGVRGLVSDMQHPHVSNLDDYDFDANVFATP